jgi:hypothetical protein
MFKNFVRFLFVFASLIIVSCEKQSEKINLYGVKQTNPSNVSHEAYLVFFVLALLIVFGTYMFYKKITKK